MICAEFRSSHGGLLPSIRHSRIYAGLPNLSTRLNKRKLIKYETRKPLFIYETTARHCDYFDVIL